MAIWEFEDYETKDLEKALELYDKLEKIGFETDDDMIQEIKLELNRRETE